MKKILEIGGGRTPYFIRYKTPWDLSDSYISIDIDESNMQLAKDALKNHLEEGNFGPLDPVLIISDASNIEMPDESVEQIVISNTLSAPIHNNWDRDGHKIKIKTSYGYEERKIKSIDDPEDPFYIERKNLLKEALRLLKAGGRLSIYTDLIIYGSSSYERLLEELRNEPFLRYENDTRESLRIDSINIQKLASKEYCCCFRAEVLPRSEVHHFYRI